MPNQYRKAFFAYPSADADLINTIEIVSKAISNSPAKLKLKIWPQTEVFGAHIPDEIRSSIDEVDVLVCDITKPNLNVYYEIGFAIGREKSIAPVVNTSFAGVADNIRREGLFQNIGYKTYENSEQLTQILLNLPSNNLVDLYSKPINFQQPLFMLDTYRKTDFRNAIVSSIKNSKIFFRSFDPVETARFEGISAINDVTASAGVVVPILAPHIDDARRHNLRAAFLAGLSHGLNRETLLIQFNQSEHVAADYDGFIVSVRNEGDIESRVSAFSQAAIVASQSISRNHKVGKKSELQKLTLGASAAENEFRTLEDYFVETSEFVRTVRGEVQILAGRKGSGKTAIFFRVRDFFRQDKGCFVTDLKPESHQLSLFREELIKVVDIGTFDHTLASFWYFVVLSELLLTIKKDAEFRSRIDSRALRVAEEIDSVLAEFRISESGDFTSRINRLGSYVIREIERFKKNGDTLTADRLTNIVFREGIGKIKGLISKHTNASSKFIFLFDNIDKGWPANGVSEFDVRLVRLLIEALDKIRRDFDVQKLEFMSVVFLRNDIYQLLVDETPDRGKTGQLSIDWTDRSKLRQVIFNRLQASMGQKNVTFEQCWSKYFVPKVGDQDSFEYFVDHCLMRPRFLIHIIENAISNAINRSHIVAEEIDCIDAVRQHSNYLVDDFGYEIRDVSGLNAEILYAFVGVESLLTKEEALSRFKKFGVGDSELEEAFHLMLWYGVLGIASDGRRHFIYDYEYRLKRLDAEIRALDGDVLYIVNPAFHVALR